MPSTTSVAKPAPDAPAAEAVLSSSRGISSGASATPPNAAANLIKPAGTAGKRVIRSLSLHFPVRRAATAAILFCVPIACHSEHEPVPVKMVESIAAGTVREFAQIEFVWIPSGTYSMGSESPQDSGDQQPVRDVKLSHGFWFAKYELSQLQWTNIMGDNPSLVVGDRLPVNNISWEDCSEMLEQLNDKGEGAFRLPTEAEWEYACRAGTGQRYAMVESSDSLDDHAWHVGNSENTLHPMGEKLPNRWGLHDMNGNTSEWCLDVYQGYGSDREVVDPAAGRLSFVGRMLMKSNPNLFPRVLRGGSYDWKDGCTCTLRDYASYTYRSANTGVRVVRDAD